MDIRIEKKQISCKLSHTLNGYRLTTSFNPLKNLTFLGEMCNYFHVTGAYCRAGYSEDFVAFSSTESKEAIIEKIEKCLDKAFF